MLDELRDVPVDALAARVRGGRRRGRDGPDARAARARRGTSQRANGKLVLVGDFRQLPEIEAGGAFGALAVRTPAIELRDNRRQHRGWEREALELLRAGDAARAIAAYRAHGELTVAPSADQVRETLVDDWWRAEGGESLMIAFRRSDVADLNRRARARMQAAGRVQRRGARRSRAHRSRAATRSWSAAAIDASASSTATAAPSSRPSPRPARCVSALRTGGPSCSTSVSSRRPRGGLPPCSTATRSPATSRRA